MWTRKQCGEWVIRSMVLVAPFVTACGNLSNSSTGWPAQLVAVDAGGDDGEALVRSDLRDLATAAKKELFQDGEPTGSSAVLKVTIRRVPDWVDAPRRAGYATMEGDTCLVELAERLFASRHAAYRKTVVWHELGHCAGLEHDREEDEVMSPTTTSFDTYDETAIERFVAEFEKSAGLLSQVSRLAIQMMFPQE